jgi:hypothetical protein
MRVLVREYLNAASYGPLPLRTLEAGRAAVGRKGRPWLIDNEFACARSSRRTFPGLYVSISSERLCPAMTGVAQIARVPPSLQNL